MRPQGTVVTVYGYQPEVGASMTAANLAWLLASAGRRVVLIDWDLESPSQHRFLRPFLPEGMEQQQEGLLDLVVDHMTRTAGPGAAPPAEVTDLHVLRYVVSCDWEFPDGGTLDLMPAGRSGPGYAVSASGLDWTDFYNRRGGADFLQSLLGLLRREYDHVLIDAPPGTAPVSSLCVQKLPDRVVLCTRLERAAVNEAAGLVRWVSGQGGGVRVFPLPTRVFRAEIARLRDARDYARRRLMAPAGVEDADEYLQRVEVPEIPYFAMREVTPALFETPVEAGSITASHLALVEYLAGVPAADVALQRVPVERLARYDAPEPELDGSAGFIPLAPIDGPAGEEAPPAPEKAAPPWDAEPAVPPAQPSAGGDGEKVKVFVSYSHDDKKYLGDGSLLGHLKLLERGGLVTFWRDEQILTGNKWDDEIRARIADSDIALVLVSQQFLISPYCQDVEIQGFLRRCEADGMVIFPVMLSACAWYEFPWLRERKFYPPDDRNIEEHFTNPGRRKRRFQEIYDQLKAQVQARRTARLNGGPQPADQ
jgi:MinD-like ATPase involved in chromosome partitioning or flagellar assembly